MIRRLKSLELQGYKTFATLTSLEFPGQITAIVGPNGSGKSNIADGIRWVLGEQSYSLLRAKRTEDMIFSGSQQRSRAGMASTKITFNNEDGWLPIDYSEVAISRRAYRDGQNEYLLNGQKVRLKDISELLSQTGLSERTYTVIGQGLVDVALALKPDERRQLFEEAAGIGLYRSRKEDALRRLETTRKNLDRILDIMTEIRPRLRSLERQSERFGEYQRLRADLEAMLLEWYGFHWYHKQQDLRVVRNDYQDQEIRLSTLRKKHAETDLKVDEARKQLQVDRQALEEAHHQLSEYHHKLEGASRQLAIIEERERSFIQQKQNIEIDIAQNQEAITQLESQEETFKKEIENRLEDFEGATSAFKKAEDALAGVESEKDAKQSDLEQYRQTRIAVETERLQALARLDELNNRVTSLRNENSKIDSAIADLLNKQTEIEKQVTSYEGSLAKIEDRKNEFSSRISEKSSQLELWRVKQREVGQEISTHETKQSKLLAQLEVLNQAEAALSGYSEGSKTVIEASRKGRLPMGIEPLSAHIIVDSKYEKAISAALGELTDLLVIPSGERDIVISYLESKEQNRVALISQDHVQPQDRNGIRAREGVIGFANELIQVEGHYRDIVDKLFSDILVIDAKETAKKLQSELIGSMKVVTLSGLVFQANGVMISGRSSSGKRIGRTRQKMELQDALKVNERKMTQLTSERDNLVQELKNIQAEYERLKGEYSQIEDDYQLNQQKLQSAQDEKIRLGDQLKWHKDRAVEIQTAVSATEEQIIKLNNDLKTIDEKLDKLQQDEKRISNSIKDLPVFELQQTLNYWQTHRIVTENGLKTARERFKDHQKRAQEAKTRLEMYQARLAEIEKGLSATRDEAVTLKADVSKINGLIEDIERTSIDVLSEKTDQKERELSALEKLQDHSHQQVVIAERHFTQLELELSRRKDQLENLRERIEDDFGLVAFDYDQKIDGQTPLPFSEELVSNLPRHQSISKDLQEEIKHLKNQIRRIGSINPEAQREYLEVKERYEFLTEQIGDLEKASDDLQEVIATLDSLMERDFVKTFKAVDQAFTEYFSELFNGGEANIVFMDEENPVEGGVDIIARLPGRRQQGLALLSGGERSLTAVALVFALLKVSPTPFCILDEVDAMLDESNVGRFIDLLRELSKKTQFVIITHNRNTVQVADVIYGVTMGRDSTSQMISLKLEDVDETYLT